jgi:hypothetical protein
MTQAVDDAAENELYEEAENLQEDLETFTSENHQNI